MHRRVKILRYFLYDEFAEKIVEKLMPHAHHDEADYAYGFAYAVAYLKNITHHA